MDCIFYFSGFFRNGFNQIPKLSDFFGFSKFIFQNYPIFSEFEGFDSRNIRFLFVFWVELFSILNKMNQY